MRPQSPFILAPNRSRAAAEPSNSRIKDPTSVGVARRSYRTMGLVPMILWLSAILVVRNMAVVDACTERQAEDTRQCAAASRRTRRRTPIGALLGASQRRPRSRLRTHSRGNAPPGYCAPRRRRATRTSAHALVPPVLWESHPRTGMQARPNIKRDPPFPATPQREHDIDNVLADRIRSSLGKREHRLDLPHVHVMVERHVALLHGEVDSEEDAHAIERAAAAVPGVVGVESYLRTGLIRGDTRPSTGRASRPPSPALTELLSAAEEAGVDAAVAPSVVRGVLATFADRLPAKEREHVQAHLPADVRPFFTPPRRIARVQPPRTVQDLVGRIVSTASELPHERGEQVTAAVIHALRAIVPAGDAAHVEAVLPHELRALWRGDVQP